MRCSEVREVLPAHVGEGYTSVALARHLVRCSECRAELARYQRVLGALDDLAAVTVEPPAGLLDALAAIPARAGLLHRTMWRAGAMTGHLARNRVAYLGGLGVALAGAALWRGRRAATA